MAEQVEPIAKVEPAAPEKSGFEKAIEAMTPEQLARVTEIVQGEAARRDDPHKRMGEMTANEFREFVSKAYGY